MIGYIYREESGGWGAHDSKAHRVTRATMKTTECRLAGGWRSSDFTMMFQSWWRPRVRYSFTLALEEVSLGHGKIRW